MLPIILGVTGAGGVVIVGLFYLFSRGVQSRCVVRQVEIVFNVRKIKANQAINKYEMRVSDMTVRQLEDTIVEAVHSTPVPVVVQSDYPMGHSHHNSMKELEDFIKDTIIHSSNRASPVTRSRSGSEDSRHSNREPKPVHEVNSGTTPGA